LSLKTAIDGQRLRKNPLFVHFEITVHCSLANISAKATLGQLQSGLHFRIGNTN